MDALHAVSHLLAERLWLSALQALAWGLVIAAVVRWMPRLDAAMRAMPPSGGDAKKAHANDAYTRMRALLQQALRDGKASRIDLNTPAANERTVAGATS